MDSGVSQRRFRWPPRLSDQPLLASFAAVIGSPAIARPDVAGGAVSAFVAIPLGVGYGMFALSALGDEYIALGAVAGLYTTIYVSLVNVLLGDKTRTIYAPRIITTFFIGLLLSQLVHVLPRAIGATEPPLILGVLLLTILLAGVFQFLLGLTRLGTLIRFTPHPVMAGFQNVAALLLFLVQLGNVLGFDRNTPFTAILPNLSAAKPLSVILAASVFLAVWKSPKLLPRVPPIVVGIVVGLFAYYGLSWLGREEPRPNHRRRFGRGGAAAPRPCARRSTDPQ